MNASHKKFATLVSGLALATVFAASASAQSSYLRIAPGEPYGLPRFGFSSVNVGFGERVQFVRNNSRAERLGLEPGDLILSLNDIPLNYRGSWNDALSHALYEDGGYVQLKIRDVRTGRVVRRNTFVGGYGGGPVEHYSTGSTFHSTGGGIHLHTAGGGNFHSSGLHFHD